MAAVRSRRRPPPAPEPPRRRRPDVSGMPRLAAIKLESDWRGPPKLTRQNISVFMAGAILFSGAAIAGAAWLGGSLFDARQAFAAQADHAAAGLGLVARDVRVEGVVGARADEVRALVMPAGRASLFAADPDDVRARVESLDWVADAKVVRRWPDEIIVQVTRRPAFARWQEDGTISVIDAAGERLLAERAADHPELPLVVGAGAAHAAEPLLRALEQLPLTRAHTAALVRVGERRWNLETHSGLTVALPEQGPVAALTRLEALQRTHRLLDRPVASLDLRAPGRLAVRVQSPLSGGPAAFEQGV